MENRIKILDGLRVVAITMVMLFHYYFLYDSDKYTITYNLRTVFRYGYLGVELFFIISGFVISLTLTKCSSLTEFAKKRLIRLFPAMILCSLITFLFFLFFDNNNMFPASHGFSNLIVSDTFVNPQIINLIFHTNLNYMDGSYWSLWVEITFYIIFGVLYFMSPKNAIRNFSIFAGLCIILQSTLVHFDRFLINYISRDSISLINSYINCFQIIQMGIWFLLGIILFRLYTDKRNTKSLIIFTFLFSIQLYLIFNKGTFAFTILTYTLLMLFIYAPQYISFLKYKLISKIGTASYSIYLIHQNIGIFIINKLSSYFGKLNFILPIVVIFVFYGFGLISYKFIENPLGLKLKELLLKTHR